MSLAQRHRILVLILRYIYMIILGPGLIIWLLEAKYEKTAFLAVPIHFACAMVISMWIYRTSAVAVDKRADKQV